MVYKPDPRNAADSLSRLRVNPAPATTGHFENIYFVAKHAVPKAFTPRGIHVVLRMHTSRLVKKS